MRRSTGEWPLVGFTLLGQAAVGMFVALGAARLLMKAHMQDDVALERILVGPVIAVGVMLHGALLLSTGHLARPLRAWRALSNLGDSWVSIEIALGAGFALAGALFAMCELLDLASPGAREALGVLTAALGLGFVAAMGQIYRLPARPAWDHAATSVGFFTTALWLGTLAAGAALVGASRQLIGAPALFPDQLVAVDSAVRWLAGGGALASLLDLWAAAIQGRVRRRASLESSLPESSSALRRHRLVAVGRAGLTVASAAAAGIFAASRPAWSALESEGAAIVAGALVCAVAAAVAGRALFYAERPRAGI